MTHVSVGFFAIVFPIAAVLFGLFAMGIVTFGKPPKETPAKPANLRPPPRPKKPPPELTEKEKRRAERRAKRRDL